LIVSIPVLESSRIGPSLIDTAFQTACQTDVTELRTVRLSTLVFEHRYGSRYVRIVDWTVFGLILIVSIPVLESSRIGLSLIDTAFQTACQTDVTELRTVRLSTLVFEHRHRRGDRGSDDHI
jgi:hypothetical protein